MVMVSVRVEAMRVTMTLAGTVARRDAGGHRHTGRLGHPKGFGPKVLWRGMSSGGLARPHPFSVFVLGGFELAMLARTVANLRDAKF